MITPLSIQEQEIVIQSCRDEKHVTMYCSDATWITKMDKLVAKSPSLFTVTAETEYGKTHKFPKRLLSIRSKIIKRELSEEMRKIMADRFKNNINKSKENEK